MDSSDFAKGIAFIVRNKDNLFSHCAGPTEAYVVEQTLAALSTPQVSSDGGVLEREVRYWLDNLPNAIRVREGGGDECLAKSFAVNVEALTRPSYVCPTCNGTKRAKYEGFGWCTCETCTVPPLQEGEPVAWQTRYPGDDWVECSRQWYDIVAAERPEDARALFDHPPECYELVAWRDRCANGTWQYGPRMGADWGDDADKWPKWDVEPMYRKVRG